MWNKPKFNARTKVERALSMVASFQFPNAAVRAQTYPSWPLFLTALRPLASRRAGSQLPTVSPSWKTNYLHSMLQSATLFKGVRWRSLIELTSLHGFALFGMYKNRTLLFIKSTVDLWFFSVRVFSNFEIWYSTV